MENAMTIRPTAADKRRRAEGIVFLLLFAPAPEVAAGEAAEHGRAPGLAALALQGEEDLLDRVGHGGAASAGRFARTQSVQPLARSSQAGHAPQP